MQIISDNRAAIVTAGEAESAPHGAVEKEATVTGATHEDSEAGSAENVSFHLQTVPRKPFITAISRSVKSHIACTA